MKPTTTRIPVLDAPGGKVVGQADIHGTNDHAVATIKITDPEFARYMLRNTGDTSMSFEALSLISLADFGVREPSAALLRARLMYDHAGAARDLAHGWPAMLGVDGLDLEKFDAAENSARVSYRTIFAREAAPPQPMSASDTLGEARIHHLLELQAAAPTHTPVPEGSVFAEVKGPVPRSSQLGRMRDAAGGYPPIEVKIHPGPTAEDDAREFPGMYEQIRLERERHVPTASRGWGKPASRLPGFEAPPLDGLEARLERIGLASLPASMVENPIVHDIARDIIRASAQMIAAGLHAVHQAVLEPATSTLGALDAFARSGMLCLFRDDLHTPGQIVDRERYEAAKAAGKIAEIDPTSPEAFGPPQIVAPAGGPEPLDNVFINIRVPLEQTTSAAGSVSQTDSAKLRRFFDRLLVAADTARAAATDMDRGVEDLPRVVLVLPPEIRQLAEMTLGPTGDGREIPILHLLAGAFPLVEIVEASASPRQGLAALVRDAAAKGWLRDASGDTMTGNEAGPVKLLLTCLRNGSDALRDQREAAKRRPAKDLAEYRMGGAEWRLPIDIVERLDRASEGFETTSFVPELRVACEALQDMYARVRELEQGFENAEAEFERAQYEESDDRRRAAVSEGLRILRRAR